MWTVSVAPVWPPVWCRKTAIGVRTVPAREDKPRYSAAFCGEHLEAFDQGLDPEGRNPTDDR